MQDPVHRGRCAGCDAGRGGRDDFETAVWCCSGDCAVVYTYTTLLVAVAPFHC